MAQPQGAEQPTQEELQAYVEQMRGADAAEIVAQAFQILAMGAEVKLGRSDARVLIDALAAVADSTGGRVPAELTNGMRAAVTQLQTAQVQQERAAGDQPAAEQGADTGQQAGQGPAATSDATGARPAGGQPAEQQGGRGGDNMTDRLWIPGR